MSRDRLALEGPEGTLEAVLEGETENPAMIAIVCHPHPQFGGTMDNKVVTTLIRAARDAGAAALRFNFRGVGESQGAYSDGIGEVEDLIAVHRWLSSLGKSGDEQQKAASVAALISGSGRTAASALKLAEETFRALPIGLLTKEELMDNKASTELFMKTLPAKLGECAAFGSQACAKRRVLASADTQRRAHLVCQTDASDRHACGCPRS